MKLFKALMKLMVHFSQLIPVFFPVKTKFWCVKDVSAQFCTTLETTSFPGSHPGKEVALQSSPFKQQDRRSSMHAESKRKATFSRLCLNEVLLICVQVSQFRHHQAVLESLWKPWFSMKPDRLHFNNWFIGLGQKCDLVWLPPGQVRILSLSFLFVGLTSLIIFLFRNT